MKVQDLIRKLSRPAAYPHPVEEVEVRQTHISVVFLAGDRAYKIKKPVNFGFVDYSTLERRRHFCREEVRLNRRLAPEVYRGVTPVTDSDSECRVGGEGEPVEWAVEMQRLPDAATLQARLEAGTVRRSWVTGLADEIAAFHREAAAGSEVDRWTRWEVVAKNVRENFGQSTEQVGTTVHRRVFERFRALSEQQLQEHRRLVERRCEQGKGRDTHGDLRLEHVYLLPEDGPADPEPAPGRRPVEEGDWRWSIVDCVEFNDAFRYADPISDMAFLVMDFIACGRRDLAEAFSRAYIEAADDAEGAKLLDLYVAYRAAVRGKVQGMKAVEEEVDQADRRRARRRSAAHWLVGLGRLEAPGRRPCLVLVGGLPGTGKSTLAGRLAGRADFEVIDSDVVRKELAGLDEGEGAAEYGAGIYTEEFSEKTYAECRRRAKAAVFEGKRVIVDASFHDADRRRQFLDTARAWGVPGRFLWCRTSEETLRRRLRARSGDVSDADWEVCRKMREEWDPLEVDEERVTREVSTDGDVETTVELAVELLEDWGLFES